MNYNYLVLKSPTTEEIIKLDFDCSGGNAYKRYVSSKNREIGNKIQNFYNNTLNEVVRVNLDSLSLLQCDNMYLEDSNGNLTPLVDYVNVARMIGYNKNCNDLVDRRGKIYRHFKFYSHDTLNGQQIIVYCEAMDILRFGEVEIVYKGATIQRKRW